MPCPVILVWTARGPRRCCSHRSSGTPPSAVLTPIASAIVGRKGGSVTNHNWLAATGSTTAATEPFGRRPSSCGNREEERRF